MDDTKRCSPIMVDVNRSVFSMEAASVESQTCTKEIGAVASPDHDLKM
ncbi:MAG TPA: hypothetical protein VHH73_00245 [Verrucomicrobiae bacterium]|nr:hypothetical protein [Verrucomicrobiae bacterium]